MSNIHSVQFQCTLNYRSRYCLGLLLKVQPTNVVVEAVEKALRVAGAVVDLGDTAKTSESKRNPGGGNGYDDNLLNKRHQLQGKREAE